MVGTVNAHRDDFVAGVEDLLRSEAFHPGWLGQLITTRVHGLENHDEMLRHLRDEQGRDQGRARGGRGVTAVGRA